jgi:hypothetical protein
VVDRKNLPDYESLTRRARNTSEPVRGIYRKTVALSKRFVAKLRHKEPEQFDRLSFLPGEEMQVDYGEGAPTLVPGGDRYKKPRLFVATLRHSRRSFRRVVWKSSQQVWA